MSIFLAATLVALLTSAVLAAAASAGPLWKFEHEPLSGSESIAGGAVKSTLTFPGLTTTCDFAYEMKIANSGGTATGEMNKVTLSNCLTNGACTVESSSASPPWPVKGVTVVSNYVIVEAVKFTLLYGGESCPLEGISAKFTGTAGGLYNNAVGAFTFSSANFKATKTEVKALGTSIEWNAFFTTEALGPHKGQILELS
jgi:hypothetical protein